jgi:sugar phosphate isomerase/epimerase
LKLGLSTWSLLQLDVGSAVRAIGDAGYDYIELWGEVPHAYPDWADPKLLRDTLSSYDMTVTAHAPFTDLNPANPFEPVRSAVARTLTGFVKFADFLGAKMVTVHPGSVHNEALVPQALEGSVSIIDALVKEADGKLTINVENQSKSRSKYHYPIASTADSLDAVLSKVQGARLTLDTGHAHVSGLSPLTLSEHAGTRLAEIHLSDNSGASDDHLIPGHGTADLRGLMERVAGTDLLVCLELDPYKYSEQQVLDAPGAMDRLKGTRDGV